MVATRSGPAALVSALEQAGRELPGCWRDPGLAECRRRSDRIPGNLADLPHARFDGPGVAEICCSIRPRELSVLSWRRRSAVSCRWSTEPTLERLDRLIGRAALGLRLLNGWKVVISGRPNVGKSRLFNALAGYARAIVDPRHPGVTRNVVTVGPNGLRLGWPVELSDTAGLRETEGTRSERLQGSRGPDASRREQTS